MQQVERLVLRTGNSVEEALITLTLVKEYDQTVTQAITEQAGIIPLTFFRHYSYKDELLKDVLSPTTFQL